MKNYQQVQSVLDGIIQDFQLEATRANIEVCFGLYKAYALGSLRGVRLIYLSDPEINKLIDIAHGIVTYTSFKSSNKQVQSQERPEQNELQAQPSTSNFRACPSPDAHTGKTSFSGDIFSTQQAIQ